jgi:hypothetical protein
MDTTSLKDEKDEYNNFLIVDEYPNNSIGNFVSSNTTESNEISPRHLKRK